MTLPDTLVLERFRSFASRTSVPLRPLTLIYGANNSGKSAILRALALIAASLNAGTQGALTLPETVFPQVSPRELAWQGLPGAHHFGIGFGWNTASVAEYLATVTPGANGDTALRTVEITRRDRSTWTARSEIDGRVPVDPDQKTPVDFEGLLPGPRAPQLADLREVLLPLRGAIRWLGSVRPPTPRLLQGVAPFRGHFTNGGEAAHLVAADSVLRERVGKFYEALDPPRTLQQREVAGFGTELSIVPKARQGWRVAVGDTGEGMSQVLPVLAYADVVARQGGLLAVEEPESHLHPTAQTSLANYLCDLLRDNTEARFLLETHSRVLLLSVQNAIAQGFPADQVQLVWVDQDEFGESRVSLVPIHPNGRLGDGWPASAMAEDLRLARELTRNRQPPVPS